jgi:hypothetical protein
MFKLFYKDKKLMEVSLGNVIAWTIFSIVFVSIAFLIYQYLKTFPKEKWIGLVIVGIIVIIGILCYLLVALRRKIE